MSLRIEPLTTPPGTRRIQRVRVELVRDKIISFPLNYQPLTGPGELAIAARALIGGAEDRETFVVLHLDSKHKINGLEIVAIGTINATLVHAREVFKGAILSNATAIALSHNHPSGDPTPSPEDHSLTAQLLQAGEILGIRVVDHVVLGDPEFVSMRETGTLWSQFQFHR